MLTNPSIVDKIKKRERLRRYEEGKIVHNNAKTMIPDLKNKKLLKSL